MKDFLAFLVIILSTSSCSLLGTHDYSFNEVEYRYTEAGCKSVCTVNGYKYKDVAPYNSGCYCKAY